MMHFFSWFFFISLGSLLAVTVLIYIYVQDNDNLGRRWGYGACTAGTRCRYRFKKLVGARPRRSLPSSCCMALAPPPAVRRPRHALRHRGFEVGKAVPNKCPRRIVTDGRGHRRSRRSWRRNVGGPEANEARDDTK
jgi:hypothetical protein